VNEWQDKKWGDIATLEYGRSLQGYSERKTGVPVFGTNGPIGWHSEALCRHPTVVIGRKGAYRGVHYSPCACFVIDTAFYLEPKTELNVRWAYYQLLTKDINSMDSGSAIPSTSRADFYQLPVLLPPIQEQRAIASVLGALDDKIELNRRMNETLEAMAQSLFKSWFVDATQNGLPEGWRESTIGEEVHVVGGSTPSTSKPEFWEGGTHHWATPKDLASLTSPVLLDTERQITDAGLAQISSGLLPVGTALLSSRAPIGYLAISEAPVAVNQGFIAMVCDKELPNHFVRLWAKQNMDVIEANANGTTFLEISKKNFRPLPVVVPPRSVLVDFKRRVEPLHQRMVLNLRESHTLAALRDTLLPKLLSGDVRVKEAAL
jgi:type I restriction enzyme, S subunit